MLQSPVLPFTTSSGQTEALPVEVPMTAVESAPIEQLVAAAVESEPTAEPLKPPFFIYTVQEGDTVGGVAARFGLSSTSILWNNLDLENADALSVGQQVRVPSSNGIIYEVRLGDTLIDVAGYYGVDVAAIVGFPANGLSSVDDIVESQTLFIPGGVMPAPAEPEPVAIDTPLPPSEPPARESDRPTSAPEPPSSGPASPSGFIWPTYGPISSYFSGGHPLGIDIDLFNNPGAAIVASASGTVTFAGGNACCSYGLYVVVSHGNGFETLSAHLGSILVSQGGYVEQGQVIGYAGLTGYTTGYHLHFEVHLNGQNVNPLNYLP